MYHEKAEQRGAYLEAAMLIGPPPATFLTAAAPLPYEADEMEVAAKLQGHFHRFEDFGFCARILAGRIGAEARRGQDGCRAV